MTSKRKVLVTGANGFIARAFIARLDPQCYDVYALAKETPRVLLGVGIKQFFIQDICQPFQLDIPFDDVFHLAACNFTHVGVASGTLYEQVNVEGTAHVLEGVKTNRFVFMSTAKVYQAQGLPLTEISPLGPQGIYEQSKLQAEAVCQQMLAKDKLIILRSTNVTGPGQALKALIPVFLKNAIEGNALNISVSCKTRLQLLYIDDLIDAFLAILDCPDKGGVYNIAPAQSVSIEDLAKQIIAESASTSNIECINQDEVLFSQIKADKFMRDFSWRPKTSVDQLIKESYLYYVKQQDS